MDDSKMNFTSVLTYHIINNYGWTNELGHYVYYRENMKKPTQKILKIQNEKCIYDIISKIDRDFEIDNIFNRNNKTNNKNNKKTNKKNKTVNYDDTSNTSNTSYIIDEENSNVIKFSPDYKFTGINLYDDLNQPENMSDSVFKEMIYLRSRFSKTKFSKFQYSFSEDLFLS